MKWYFAVGHGLTDSGVFDPGARDPISGLTEQSAGDIVVGAAARVVRAAGVDVISEARTSDGNWAWTARRANAMDVDLVVAWHHDWYAGIDAVHGFWFPGNREGERLMRGLAAASGAAGHNVRDSWVKARDLALLRRTAMTAILVECGRIGGTLLRTEEALEALGEVHGRALLEMHGIRHVPERETEMDWLKSKRWPQLTHRIALELESEGVITPDTNPHEKVGDWPAWKWAVFSYRLANYIIRKVRA